MKFMEEKKSFELILNKNAVNFQKHQINPIFRNNFHFA